jgi:aminoglycoside phosphotransferase family enzyme
VDRAGDGDLAEKLAWLRRPESFPDAPEAVEAIETHFAWVFLSNRFAYKLKKALRIRDVDFTTLAARRAGCELEIALNRRLAEAVYIGVVPLVRRESGFALEADGDAVEWLVKMRRLPRERMLDQAAQRRAVADADLEAVLDKLDTFYRRTARAPWDGAAYCEHLSRQIERYSVDLAASDLGLDRNRVRATVDGLLRFVHEHADLFGARIAARRVVDAHGDLRPEHVCLVRPPEIIDCLEFSATLRLLDTAEEIAFLALECDRLGHGAVGARILHLYRQRDRVDAELLAFYRRSRALVRALTCVWHLRDLPLGAAAAPWRERTAWYLDAAAGLVQAACREPRPGEVDKEFR